jgi:hypothetical protein
MSVTILAICCALFGLALGIRFRFFVLLPILFVGLLAIVVLAITQDLSLTRMLSIAVIFAGCLQLGYLISALFRHLVGPALIIGQKAPPLAVRSSVER